MARMYPFLTLEEETRVRRVHVKYDQILDFADVSVVNKPRGSKTECSHTGRVVLELVVPQGTKAHERGMDAVERLQQRFTNRGDDVRVSYREAADAGIEASHGFRVHPKTTESSTWAIGRRRDGLQVRVLSIPSGLTPSRLILVGPGESFIGEVTFDAETSIARIPEELAKRLLKQGGRLRAICA